MAGWLTTRRPGRAAALLLLLLFVVAAHLWATREIAQLRAAWGEGAKLMPPRLQVTFVRELAPKPPPAAPPVAAPPPKPKPRPKPRRAPQPASASAPVSASASASEAAAAASPTPAPVDIASAAPREPTALAASEAGSAPSGASISEAAAPPAVETPTSAVAPDAAAAFEWPPSTRLEYGLTGNYRGELLGTAQVQWVRVESRYQVHLDVVVGPRFAPLFTRRMSSDGELGAQGLMPRRYDEETRMAFSDARRWTLLFEPDRIVMGNGSARKTVPGVQDTASQFVQLTWMFTLRPDLLQAGRTIELPLALPRRIDPWVYDVIGPESLVTPIGQIETVHLKPRREAKAGDILSSELWFAPSLQYLPVRILIHQDAQTFIDLLISARPMQTQ